MYNKSGIYLCSVPNNGIGKTFIVMLKRYLNNRKWYLRVRGRHPERAKLAIKMGFRKNYFDRDMPLGYAKTLVVYVTRKKETPVQNSAIYQRHWSID